MLILKKLAAQTFLRKYIGQAELSYKKWYQISKKDFNFFYTQS